MKCKRLIYLLLLLTIPHLKGYSQSDKIVIRFLDAETHTRLRNVHVLTGTGVSLSTSDTSGYVVLPIDAFKTNRFLIATHRGYKYDTLRGPLEEYYLYPLSAELATATISGAPARKLINLPSEYVVDYSFNGNLILLASYSGNNGRNAKMLLLDNSGTELGRCAVPGAPVSLYNSCLGKSYCVCADKFYPLTLTGSKISLVEPYPINLLRGLQQCEQSINGNLYYHIPDKFNFRTVYGMIARGDSTFKPFTIFEQPEEARASQIELIEIISLLEHWQWHEAGRRIGLRTMWDKGALKHMNLPLQTTGDTLIVFDYFQKKLLLFDTMGASLGTKPAGFDWNAGQRFHVIKDEQTNKLYLHRYANNSAQTIEELDIHTGQTISIQTIAKPLAENVKVHNGKIYYLWRDTKTAATPQLYVQQMEDGSTTLYHSSR